MRTATSKKRFWTVKLNWTKSVMDISLKRTTSSKSRSWTLLN